MGTLVFVCPATGLEVTTGIEMDQATLLSLRGEPLRCPYCLEPHQISGIQVWIVPSDHKSEPSRAA
jgi:hypothetical protein